MVFGSPGGDQQEQWQLLLFLRHVHHGLNLQEAIDLPMSHTAHFPSSFYPREQKPGHLMAEESYRRGGPRRSARAAATRWRSRRHGRSAGSWRQAATRTDCCTRAATPRLMQAYAVGR